MTGQHFQDYFSRVSASYARFRPTYPGGLFDTVAQKPPGSTRLASMRLAVAQSLQWFRGSRRFVLFPVLLGRDFPW
jgi:hypothetical protein